MRTLRIDQFLKEQDTTQWLVQDLLPNVGWTLLYSERGSGKTTFAIQLCMALEEGKTFCAMQTTKTHTMYIQADSVSDEWRSILQRVCPKAGGTITTVDVPERCMANEKYVAYLKEMVGKHKPGFLVFDSLYNLASKTGQINSDGILDDINQMKAIAGNNSIPWMLIHHPPHGEARAAGSNSIGGNCSNDWLLLKGKLKINKGRLVKQKDIPLGRDADGRWIAKGSTEDSTDLSYDDILNHKIG